MFPRSVDLVDGMEGEKRPPRDSSAAPEVPLTLQADGAKAFRPGTKYPPMSGRPQGRQDQWSLMRCLYFLNLSFLISDIKLTRQPSSLFRVIKYAGGYKLSHACA